MYCELTLTARVVKIQEVDFQYHIMHSMLYLVCGVERDRLNEHPLRRRGFSSTH